MQINLTDRIIKQIILIDLINMQIIWYANGPD
jgi:hypothetical protein